MVKSSEEDKLVVIAAAISTHEAVKAWVQLKEEGKKCMIQGSILELSTSSPSSR